LSYYVNCAEEKRGVEDIYLISKKKKKKKKKDIDLAIV